MPGRAEIIETNFNPFAPGIYEVSVPLYIDDPELSLGTAYMDL